MNDIWGDFGDGQLPDYGTEKTQEQKDEEFLSRFRNRSYTIEHQLANAEIFGDAGLGLGCTGNTGRNGNALDGNAAGRQVANGDNALGGNAQNSLGGTSQGNFRPREQKVSTRFGTENAALALEMNDEGTSVEDRRDIYMGKKPQSMVSKPKFRPDN